MLHRRPIAIATVSLSVVLLAYVAAAQNGTKTGGAALTIGGDVTTPLTLSVADLEKMPQMTLRVTNPHNHKLETYQGVPLDTLLQQAGVPHGEAIRGKWMRAYVLVTAADGYRVVYSLAELDPGFLDSEVLVADRMNGEPLGPHQGPLKLVAPHDKRPARWVRMLKSITVFLAK